MNTNGAVPSKVKTVDDIDHVLAEELNEMSFKDRNDIQEEIHCVKSFVVAETPELIDRSLTKLRHEVQALPIDARRAYDDTLVTDSNYAHSQEFCLKFLRAELFDAKKAAARMAKYLTLMFKIFGPIALTRPMRFDDLEKKEQEEMKTGFLQTLPSRDKRGRLISFFRGNDTKGITNFNRVGATK